jgi:hypothetical protein
MDQSLLPDCPECGARAWVLEVVGDDTLVQYGPDGEEVVREEGQPGTNVPFRWFRCVSPAHVDGDIADDKTAAILEALARQRPRVCWFPGF